MPDPIGPGNSGGAAPAHASEKKPMSTAGLLLTGAAMLALPAAILVGLWFGLHYAWQRWPDGTPGTLFVLFWLLLGVGLIKRVRAARAQRPR